MATPTNRTPIKLARGSYSNLNSSLDDIQEGEIIYAEDQNKLYVKEGTSLIDVTGSGGGGGTPEGTSILSTGETGTSKFLRIDGDNSCSWQVPPDTNTTYSVGDGGLTTKDFTTTLKTKLDGIATGAEVNVQSDWNSSSGDNKILNKPTVPSSLSDLSDVHNATPSDGQVLKWVNAESRWEPGADSTGGGGGGATNLSNTADGTKLTIESSSGNNTDLPAVTTSAWGVMTDEDKTKLDGIATGATANAGTVTSVTGTSPIASSGGATPAISISAATTSAAGSMSSTDKTKLDGIASSANNYTHPAVNHIPAGGSSGQVLKWSSTGTAAWGTDNDTTYSVGDGGLTTKDFTTTLKTKLDGIAANATANAGTVTNVTGTSPISVSNGTTTPAISVDLSGYSTTSHNHNSAYAPTAGSSSVTTLGTISAGTWQGTAIADGYISSASTWNGKQAALTFGIANTNAVKIDHATVGSGEYAKFTSSGLEGKTTGELKTDLSLAKADVGLSNVENTAVSTWAGSSNVTTLGTVSTLTSSTTTGDGGGSARKIFYADTGPDSDDGAVGDIWLEY